MDADEITIEPCPCGMRGCHDFHLVGIGNFCQGSGFTKDEATLIAKLLNNHFKDCSNLEQS